MNRTPNQQANRAPHRHDHDNAAGTSVPQPRRVRWAVRPTLIWAVAANVLHAQPSPVGAL
jgi:hypothetical protein